MQRCRPGCRYRVGWNSGVQLTLFQPGGGADYTHQITACSPGFENLTTSLGCREQDCKSFESGLSELGDRGAIHYDYAHHITALLIIFLL